MKRGADEEMIYKLDAVMDSMMGGEEKEETGDFVLNEKDKLVNLTENGVAKVERFFHIELRKGNGLITVRDFQFGDAAGTLEDILTHRQHGFRNDNA